MPMRDMKLVSLSRQRLTAINDDVDTRTEAITGLFGLGLTSKSLCDVGRASADAFFYPISPQYDRCISGQ